MTFIKSLWNRIQNSSNDSWCKGKFLGLYQFTWYSGVKVLGCFFPHFETIRALFFSSSSLHIFTLKHSSALFSQCPSHSNSSDQSSSSHCWCDVGRKWLSHLWRKKRKKALLIAQLSQIKWSGAWSHGMLLSTQSSVLLPSRNTACTGDKKNAFTGGAQA